MSAFRATPEFITNAATSCTNTAAEIQAQLSALQQYVVNLEVQWQGIASTTFNALMVDYNIFATMLHNALTDIASGLQGNAVNYTETEQQNISNLVAVNGSVPGARL